MLPGAHGPPQRHSVQAVHTRWRAAVALTIAALLLMSPVALGCGSWPSAGDGQGDATGRVEAGQLVVATGTSVKDSGLMDDVVLPAFAEAYPEVDVKVLAVGSGEAMTMGERGEVDVLLVHSPAVEEAFMAKGYGTLRLPVARNYFAIVGPRSDPAGCGDAESATEAMRAIADSGALFVSRGDGSGAHVKELSLWAAAGVKPVGDWYIETGQGMGETLRITNEKQGYTLTDLGTYLAMRDDLDLAILTEDQAELANRYSVIIVNQNRHPAVNAAAAEQFAGLLVSRRIQEALKDYGVAQVGRPLFSPDASSLGQ